MANQASSYTIQNPAYIVPEILTTYQQASGAFNLLAGGNPMVRLSDGDLQVYIKHLDVRTKVGAGQSAANLLPGVDITTDMISTPTYMFRMRSEYDHHDTASMGRWGISIVEAQRLGARQGIFQQLRNVLLFGFNPANGEGLMNAQFATTMNLPADTNGNTSISTYDSGQLGQFIAIQIGAAKVRCNQIGMPARVTILTTQHVMEMLSYQVVQLTQYQRPGAGVTSPAGVATDVAGWMGDEVTWSCDDTLIGKGAGGNDVIIISIPEVKKPVVDKINTNYFAQITPGLAACNLQYMDMAAPRELPCPIPGGAIDITSELCATSGWAVRGQATTIISCAF
jgi:hypothetical protein